MSRRFSGAGAVGLATLGALVSILFPTSDTRAFDEPDATAVIGTFDLRAPDSAPDDVRQLYDDALDDLSAGERQAAQRQLEQVVSRAPDSRLAAEARHLLAGLYAGQGVAAKSRGEVEHPPQSDGVAAESGSPERRTSSVSPDLEQEFRSESGDRVFFGSGSADLGARAKAALALQARWLRARTAYAVLVEGFADDQPMTGEQQERLSDARARAVRDQLVEQGIASERIEISARGTAEPVADCAGPDCAAQNRRAVTRLRAPAGMRQSGARSGSGQTLSSAGTRLSVH